MEITNINNSVIVFESDKLLIKSHVQKELDGKLQNGVCLSIAQLNEKVKPGTPVPREKVTDSLIDLIFTNPKSIDVLVLQLLLIKDELEGRIDDV